MGRICYPPKRHTFNFVCFANIQKKNGKRICRNKKDEIPRSKGRKKTIPGTFYTVEKCHILALHIHTF